MTTTVKTTSDNTNESMKVQSSVKAGRRLRQTSNGGQSYGITMNVRTGVKAGWVMRPYK